MKAHYAIGLAIFSGVAGAVAAHVQGLHAEQKPKAYVVGEIEVTDLEESKPYIDGIAALVPQAGGRFLARGNKVFALAGAPPKPIIEIIEWNSMEQAQAFFSSDAYTNLIPGREVGSKFRAFIVEGSQ